MRKTFTWIFFEEKFKALENKLKVQAKALKEALNLQAKENKRRFTELNGEAGRLKAMKQELTPREVFDNAISEVNKKLDIINDWKIKQEGKSQLTQYIPWLLAAISIVLMYTKK
jgi:hypothetical protein